MALIANLQPLILPEVPGASIPLIDSATKRIIKEFMANTRLWQADIQPFNTVVGQASYELPQAADIDVVRIERVRVDGFPVDPTSEEELDDLYQRDWQTLQGRPRWYFTRDGGTRITFCAVPGSVMPVTIRAALTLNDLANTYPDFIDIKYREILLAGIKSNLMLMPEAAWRNENMALLYGAQYLAGTDKAKFDSAKGGGRARLRTVARFM